MRRLLEKNQSAQQLRSIGIDGISIRKGHTCAVVVTDLDHKRPIWLGGPDGTGVYAYTIRKDSYDFLHMSQRFFSNRCEKNNAIIPTVSK